jgi:hypothetical protein
LDFAQAAISSFITITLIVVLIAGVMKVFQIANELGEMKSLLKDIKHNGEDLLPQGRSATSRALGHQLTDPDEARTASMLRSLSAEEYAAALQPEVVQQGDSHQPEA